MEKEKISRISVRNEISNLKNKEEEILKSKKKLKEKLDKLSDVERRILYRKCYLNKEEVNIYDINLTENEITTLEKIYDDCYATFLEKSYKKNIDIKSEKFNSSEIEMMLAINTHLSNTEWDKKTIESTYKNHERIKEIAIKYRYLALIDSETFPHPRKNNLQEYMNSQIFTMTDNEISSVKAPITLTFKSYQDYETSNKSFWYNLENIKGLPYEEIAKLVLNIETKSNIHQNKINKDKQLEEMRKKAEKEAKEEKKKNQLNKLIELAIYYVEAFLEQENNETTFCEENDITLEQFKQFTTIVRKNNVELYNEYENKHKNIKRKELKKEINELEEVIFLIKNGIEENGQTRKFASLDYFMHTSLTIDEAQKIMPYMGLSAGDTRAIKHLIGQIMKGKKTTAKELLSIDIQIIDQDNNIRVIQKEEQQLVIDFLEENNIPLLTNLYTETLNKYIKGELPELNKKIREI